MLAELSSFTSPYFEPHQAKNQHDFASMAEEMIVRRGVI